MSAEHGFAEPGGRDKGRSTVSPEAVPAARVHLAYLDGLRALAAAYVVGFHAVLGFYADDLTGPWRLLRRLFAFGHEAVAVFIVLSGYCLMLPVVRANPARPTLALGRFVRRRALRILPPYYAALALSLALLAAVPALRVRSGTTWDDSLPGLDAGAIISHLLVVHNWFRDWAVQINGPLWSVATEWQIYFFFPLLLLPVWRRLGMYGALSVAALVGYAPLALAPRAANAAIPWYLLLFTFGMAAAAVGYASPPPARRIRRSGWSLISGTTWLACSITSVLAAPLWFTHKPLVDLAVGFGTATLLIALTGHVTAATRSHLLTLLESRPLVGLGHFSYSLYLTHLPVLALCQLALHRFGWHAWPGALALLVVGGSISAALAYVFHVLVERPFMLAR